MPTLPYRNTVFFNLLIMNTKVLLEKLKKLEEKYEINGQNLESYLDGLYEADFLNYWDYIHLDTLLSLQTKRTGFPDEEIFIVFHQVSELYFRLILLELGQICHSEEMENSILEDKLTRINRYFQILIHSFPVMSQGMDPGQFMHFRLALMPASGFQSVQFRYIEFMCTDVDNLLNMEMRGQLKDALLDKKMESLYWRYGSTDLKTGRKTLTLTRFEQKYDQSLVGYAGKYRLSNLRSKFIGEGKMAALPDSTKNLFRELDYNINQGWRMVHLQSAGKYLKKPDTAVEATGGTNWQKYLPPGFQKIIFFPELWSAEELENWGKGSHDFSGENAYSKT